jgi:hypothetical protein
MPWKAGRPERSFRRPSGWVAVSLDAGRINLITRKRDPEGSVRGVGWADDVAA